MENKRKRFLSINPNIDVYTSLFSSGLIVAPKEVKTTFGAQYLYIIGFDISYDTVDWLKYNKFTILPINESTIKHVYITLFGENKLQKKIELNLSIHNLFHEILLSVKHWERVNLLANFFQVKTIKQYSTDEICKIVDFQIPNVGYKHYDINTGLKFVGEEYDE